MDRRVGVVTGAGGNIGRATAELLGREGFGVLCVDSNQATVDATVAAIRAAGGLAEGFAADVTDEAQVYAYAAKCNELWGCANFFFNNAGVEGAKAPLASYPTDAWDKVIAVNLRGVFLGLKAMLPLLRHADAARVVNTASVAGIIGTPMLAAYGASKHAVVGLTMTAAIEFAPMDIAVNAICPGPVESDMMRRIEEGVAPGAAAAAHDQYEQNIPATRYAKLEEVAELAVYLLTKSPMYMTGQAVAIDGAMTAK
ncbi:MAG: SDR family oxidoreductase [Dehalococcoidia bacterium]|nr:SDR family oxidoreductase [Dehalococcoidia bacterium]